nr:reverse transcriptase domain-containing protein [Tanacetum cinerariifolium]
SPSPYNGIIRRPGISAIRAVPSTAHEMLKFLIDGGIVTIYNTTVPHRECNTVACDATGRAEMWALLQRNLDIFAWEPKHMTGVPRSIIEHKLKIRQGYSPVRQKKHGQAPERAKAILEEVHKLVDAVMVKKSDGSWRMYVDFIDINKACPLDCYPLPEIDWKVESLCGYPFKCFLDAYKGYHQIQMAKEDEEKTAFHTSQGVYCYTKMPFGLKNVVDKSLALFKTLKKCTKKRDFRWTTEAEEAFTQLKQHIATLPTLVAPRPGEELIMYLSVTHGVISAVLLTDRNSVRTPVYFVSKALKKTEVNYSAMEKLVLALVFAAKRLRRYFQAHPIMVIMDQPIKQVISKPDASGRLQSLILTNPEGMEFTYALRFEFTATNNEAEYEALIAGLRIVTRMGARKKVGGGIVARLVGTSHNNKVSTGDTPFSLVYGTEAVIPAEIGMPTIHTVEVNVATNDDERLIDLDLLEERRKRAAICEAKAKSKMKGYYDAKVRGLSFRPGDFVRENSLFPCTNLLFCNSFIFGAYVHVSLFCLVELLVHEIISFR